ncbi:MAG: radical SAM family heme chaperone HemW [Chloroflexi bacterium]|nr:radical SAM family heme chaperone HemW [Chloroflexota bacterium]
MAETSIYFHIPFCNRRCGYCDFNTFEGMKQYLPPYSEAICLEIENNRRISKRDIQVGTLFFGGGTPSLLDPQQLKKILMTTSRNFAVNPAAEVTLEANPGTVSKAYLEAIRSLGINRISYGMQSANPDDLRILDRQHQHLDVIQSILWSKQAGFEHINLDLIFGIPRQSLQRWKDTIELALLENIDHFSLYSLSIEEGTPLKHWIDRGLMVEPDEDLSAEMYEYASDRFSRSGFQQYEISNWAKPHKKNVEAKCRHNLQYWRYLPYLGFGAGAHGFHDGFRTENENGILSYIEKIRFGEIKPFPMSPASSTGVELGNWDQMQEFMMVGFRLTDEGVSKTEFRNRFGYSMEQVFGNQLSKLIRQSLIEIHPVVADRYRLTKKGRLLGNRVFIQFVGNPKPPELN